jgi:hypothetical protein
MTTLGTNRLNYADILRRQKPDGTMAIIAEPLNQMNGLWGDLRWVVGDLPGGAMSTARTSLPAFSTLNPNGTATTTKSTTGQLMEPTMWITALSEVHDMVARYGGDVAAVRASEATAFGESAKQSAVGKMLSANGSTTPGDINGILTRYNATSNVNGGNIVLCGALAGQTDCMSILFVQHGEGLFEAFYPKGSMAGLEIRDHGMRVSEPSSTTRKVVWTEEWLLGFGIKIPNYKAVVRLANIDKSLLVGGTGADLFDKMTMGWHLLPRNVGSSGRGIYMNTTTRMMLDIQARNDVQAGGGIKFENVGGELVETFRGIPINLEDQLTEAESVVS